MNHMQPVVPYDAVSVLNRSGQSNVVLVCEHASCFIPPVFNDLGLDVVARQSHIAWDSGALGVARSLAERFDAKVVASNVSRLIYDCNRPPSAADAIPVRSGSIFVAGNADLTVALRQDRVVQYYEPFRATLAATLAAISDPIVVTVHSFTPIYNGTPRSVEIGILHDTDERLAVAMIQVASAHTQKNVELNVPYGPQDGVTHTLREHAIIAGRLNVMLEVRNDLIEHPAQQHAMATCLANWLADALSVLKVPVDVQC
jgi:predicted N-formylglutamate amidohydrolase